MVFTFCSKEPKRPRLPWKGLRAAFLVLDPGKEPRTTPREPKMYFQEPPSGGFCSGESTQRAQEAAHGPPKARPRPQRASLEGSPRAPGAPRRAPGAPLGADFGPTGGPRQAKNRPKRWNVSKRRQTSVVYQKCMKTIGSPMAFIHFSKEPTRPRLPWRGLRGPFLVHDPGTEPRITRR